MARAVEIPGQDHVILTLRDTVDPFDERGDLCREPDVLIGEMGVDHDDVPVVPGNVKAAPRGDAGKVLAFDHASCDLGRRGQPPCAGAEDRDGARVEEDGVELVRVVCKPPGANPVVTVELPPDVL